ncbi:uncharacterized protein LOC102671670 isoform X1 [Apis dorsata]|uniref:uncharacterized protein LOC102671670 isoform X1 n=1 Tax=Apis dorsata TaxID=7462 RepID=UPI0012940155|nr:uncharacterized protein LOC102671670 isoform X1 [Apis dorsata]
MKMNFQNLNRLNTFVNVVSGNILPITDIKKKLSIVLKIYSIFVWMIELAYLAACILGLFNVSRERALKDSTVNIVISLEVFILIVYLHNRKNLLRELIGKLNYLLLVEDETLGDVTIGTVKPLEKPLRIYIIASVGSLMIWASLPLTKMFRKNEFYYTDYQVPAVISNEPFPIGVFIGGVVLQIFGSAYTLLRKISLDLYTMHLILLITAQYKYLRIKFATILEQETSKDFYNGIIWQNVSYEYDKMVKQEMKLLTRHFEIVVEMTVMLKKLLSPNIGILYINYVFRFCFLSFMLATSSAMYFEKCLLVSYTIGALIQFYILCYCIQHLFEASSSVGDDVIYEKWYSYDVRFQRVILMINLANELKCKISNFQNIDLTLPSFMSILNQAYSVCLLFLKSRQD